METDRASTSAYIRSANLTIFKVTCKEESASSLCNNNGVAGKSEYMEEASIG